jgi:hypothetical protein
MKTPTAKSAISVAKIDGTFTDTAGAHTFDAQVG